jgi:flavin-dependent dehydrogenase
VQRFLPPHQRREKPLNYFKGKFPIAPAKNLFGDRYVTIGDAAGLMRPFKGKGINSAIITGVYSARSIMRHGVSKQAFAENFYPDCRELTEDLPYGRMVRILTNLATSFKFMDHMIVVAAERPAFMKAMFGSVSGHDPYKKIIIETASVPLAFTFAQKILGHFVLCQQAHLPVKITSPTA